MKSYLLFAVALVIVAIFVNEAEAQLNANPTIPPHLLPCYRHPEMFKRENRLVSKFRRFVDLIKKIERSRGGQQKSARDVAMALLYHLRLDGIQPTPNVQQTQDVTPFAPGGNNYYKHRLTLVGLLPKPNRPTNFAFLNESLTEYEMCNLHFMLSYSIDPYKRDNEDCSNLKLEDGGNRFSQGYESSYYGYRYDTYRSHPRRTREINDKWEMQMQSIENRVRNLRMRLDNMRRRRRSMRSRRSTVDREENLRSPDVEVIPVHVLESMSKSQNKTSTEVKKEQFTLGHQDLIGPGMDHILRGGYQASRTNEGNLNKRKVMYYGDETSKLLVPQQTLSACPIENGVVQHKYGSVTIGAVIGGIAAGFNFQKLSLADFNTQLKGPLANEKINNIWATTLAGNAADLILSLGFVNNLRDGVGLKGGWNSQARPQWYMLEKGTPYYLTDVELRGALDGLWLGLTIEKNIRQMGVFSLSQILEMYYSDDDFIVDPNVKASKRGEQVTAYAPTEEFKKQLHLLAVVMQNQRVNTVTYMDYTNAVADTVAAINSYIPQLYQFSPRQSLSTSSQNRLNIDQKIDLAVIIDPSWDLDSLEFYIGELIENELGATPGQSNLTILCPNDAALVLPVTDSINFDKDFVEFYYDCKKGGGLNFRLMHDLMLNHYSQALRQENIDRRINPYSFVTIFIISDSQRAPEPETAAEDLQRIKALVPDGPFSPPMMSPQLPVSKLKLGANGIIVFTHPVFVKKAWEHTVSGCIEIIVATNGPREKFKDLVVRPETDLFTLKVSTDFRLEDDANDLLNRVARAPRRLSNPAAANDSDNGSYYEGDAELNDDVRIGRTVIYKIDPYYIYNSKDIKINIRTKGHTITACTSREQVKLPPYMERNFHSMSQYPETGPYPNGDGYGNGNGDGVDDNDGRGSCQKGTSVVFDFENLCEDAGSMEECNPLYLSIQAPLQSKLEIKCVNCRYPTNVEYNIKVTGLSSDSPKTILISTSLLLLSTLVSTFTSKLF